MSERKFKSPDFDGITLWFDEWLKEPLSDREKAIIREAYYCFEYPQATEKFSPENYHKCLNCGASNRLNACYRCGLWNTRMLDWAKPFSFWQKIKRLIGK